MKARSWRSNFAALGWAALGLFGLLVVSALVVAPLGVVLDTSRWETAANSCVDGDSASDVVGAVLIVAAMAAVVLTPLIRALRRRVLLADGVLSCYETWFTWHVPVTRIESVSEPSDSGAVQVRLRDGGRVELPSELVSGPSGEMLVATLRAEVRASVEPAGDAPPVYVATARRGAWRVVPIVLGTLMFVGFLFAGIATYADDDIRLDKQRTAVATADVVAVDVRHEPKETHVSVILPLTDAPSVRAEVTHPGRIPLAVEDRIPVEYDPADLCNVSFVDRPVPNRTVVDAALNGGAALWYGALAAFVVVAVIAWRRARRAKHGG